MSGTPPVVIIGAGVGGLTLALLLRQRGISAEVLEQSSELREVGAAVLLPDGRDVPDDVTLVIVGKPAKHRARVVWRVSPLIALQFKTD